MALDQRFSSFDADFVVGLARSSARMGESSWGLEAGIARASIIDLKKRVASCRACLTSGLLGSQYPCCR